MLLKISLWPQDVSKFTTSPKLDKLGMRGSNTSEVVFDNVQVPGESGYLLVYSQDICSIYSGYLLLYSQDICSIYSGYLLVYSQDIIVGENLSRRPPVTSFLAYFTIPLPTSVYYQ